MLDKKQLSDTTQVLRNAGMSIYDISKIRSKLYNQAGNREIYILNNVSYAKTEGNILYIYSKDGRGFGVDCRLGATFGDICN